MKINPKVKKTILIYAFLLIAFLIQTSPATHIGLEFFIPCLVVVSMFINEKEAAVAGIVFGLFYDIESRVIGYHIILFMFFAYFTSVLINVILRRNVLTVLILTESAVVITNFFTFIFFLLVWGNGDVSTITEKIVPKILWAIPISVVVYFLFTIIRNKTEKLWEEG